MSNWLISLKSASSRPYVRLVCFPYAGGAPTVYRPWQRFLSTEVEMFCAHLPGREARMKDRPLTDANQVVDALVSAMEELQPVPTVFFGHSLGALLAYEVAQRLLTERARSAPEKLILSGCAPPNIDKHPHEPPPWELPDDAFVEKLRQLNGTPEEILASKELLSLFIPVLRADFQLAYNSRAGLKAGLNLPAHILGGTDDSDATQEDLQQWRTYLTKLTAITMFPGGHFFLNNHQKQVCDIVERHLASLACYFRKDSTQKMPETGARLIPKGSNLG